MKADTKHAHRQTSTSSTCMQMTRQSFIIQSTSIVTGPFTSTLNDCLPRAPPFYLCSNWPPLLLLPLPPAAPSMTPEDVIVKWLVIPWWEDGFIDGGSRGRVCRVRANWRCEWSIIVADECIWFFDIMDSTVTSKLSVNGGSNPRFLMNWTGMLAGFPSDTKSTCNVLGSARLGAQNKTVKTGRTSSTHMQKGWTWWGVRKRRSSEWTPK